ncbi:MAG: hypothetical protein FWG44_07925 [Oscillospiraceae bacterium]|nr:hypothetical protein [Oscillospiraceae bacterium]
MIALIIIGAVVFLTAVIMNLPIVFIVDFQKEARIKVRLLLFDLFKEKPEKKKRVKKKKIKKQKKPEKSVMKSVPVKTDISEQPQKSISETKVKSKPIKPAKPAKPNKSISKNIPDIDMKLIKMLIDSVAHPFKRLIKKIKITELRIDSIVGGEDAAKAAMNYGLQNAAVYSGLEWLKTISRVKIQYVNIQADFIREDSVFDLHFKISIKIGTILVCGLMFLLKIMKLKSAETETKPKQSKRIRV